MTIDVQAARTRLQEERERLHSLDTSLDVDAQPPEELSSVDQHPADMGTETFEQSKDVSIRAQIRAQLADLGRAETRIADGTYGLCEACGRPIGEERLEARPTARFCVDDQREAERAPTSREGRS